MENTMQAKTLHGVEIFRKTSPYTVLLSTYFSSEKRAYYGCGADNVCCVGATTTCAGIEGLPPLSAAVYVVFYVLL